MKNIEYTEHGAYCDIKVDGEWQHREIKEIRIVRNSFNEYIPELMHNEKIIKTVSGGSEIITL